MERQVENFENWGKKEVTEFGVIFQNKNTFSVMKKDGFLLVGLKSETRGKLGLVGKK